MSNTVTQSGPDVFLWGGACERKERTGSVLESAGRGLLVRSN